MTLVPTHITDSILERYHPELKRLAKAVEIIEHGEIALSPLPNGNYAVRSHSKGGPVHYQVNPRYESCTCPDAKEYSNGQGNVTKPAMLCKHLLAYLIAREMNLLSASPLAIEWERAMHGTWAADTADIELALDNAETNGLIVGLDHQPENVIADRERLVAQQRSARGEWFEELF